MRISITFGALLVLLGWCRGLATASEGAPTPPPGADMAFVGAKIYPSPTDEPIAEGVVLTRNGKITAVGRKGNVAIPPHSRVVDCAGLVLTAGFWNSHVHLIETKWENSSTLPVPRLSQQLEEMLTRYGFTTVFDTGSAWAETTAIRRRVESGEIDGPGILTVGQILSVKDGLTPDLMRRLGYLPDMTSQGRTPEEGAEKAARLLEAGANGIKIYAATSVGNVVEMPLEVVQAIAREAHRYGKPVFSHPYNAQGLEASIAGGVDILVHTIPNAGKLSRSQISRMKRHRVALIPTLKLWKVEAAREEMPADEAERFVNVGVDQLREYFRAGGEILFGTDVGYIDYDPTDEYALMERAGMDYLQILNSLTTAPARRFGRSRRTGRIAAGKDADMVLLGGDPAADVRAFSAVRYTVRAGKVIYHPD